VLRHEDTRKRFNTHPKEREYTRNQVKDQESCGTVVAFVRIHGLPHKTGVQYERYMRYRIPSCKTRVLVADSEYNLHDMKNSYLSMPNSGCTLTSRRRKKRVYLGGWYAPFTWGICESAGDGAGLPMSFRKEKEIPPLPDQKRFGEIRVSFPKFSKTCRPLS
jgi:hypothetical protein